MNAIVLTPVEWEWFKQLARSRVENRMAPQDIRRKLVELKLMEESRVGGLGPTVQGRDVLKLVDDRWRGAYRRRGRRLLAGATPALGERQGPQRADLSAGKLQRNRRRG